MHTTDYRQLLRCPACRGPVRFEADHVACEPCGRSWPLLDGGIAWFAEDEISASEALQHEVEAQTGAADVYEDAKTLAHHWDRWSIADLGRRFQQTSGLVMDLGCGPGFFAQTFPQYEVVGIDVTPALLQRSRPRSALVVGAAAEALPFADGTFDMVYARGVLHHLRDPVVALREVRRVLRPGGEALFHDPRAFAPLEVVKHLLRRRSKVFSEVHKAFRRDEYRGFFEASGLEIASFEDTDPIGVLLLSGLDLLRVGRWLGAAPVTRALLRLDTFFDRFLRPLPGLRTFGFILTVRAVRPPEASR